MWKKNRELLKELLRRTQWRELLSFRAQVAYFPRNNQLRCNTAYVGIAALLKVDRRV